MMLTEVMNKAHLILKRGMPLVIYGNDENYLASGYPLETGSKA